MRVRSVTLLTLAPIATVVAMAAVWPSARIPGAVAKVYAHDGGCSVASLRGAYAYRRTGTNPNGLHAEIGVTIYNGDGTFGGSRSSISENGVISDWHNAPPGDAYYTVDPDCTGSIFAASGEKMHNFVVFDRGKSFFVLTTRPDRIITAEGHRIETGDD